MKSHRAFTLIELLLVLAIIGVIAAVTVPNIARSMRGSRRRTASRIVVMAGRYARSMAILQQKDVTLSFNVENASVSVALAGNKQPKDTKEDEKDNEESDVSALGLYEETSLDSDEPDTPALSSAGLPPIERKLEHISIVSVEVDGEGEQENGDYAITYFSNGRCYPYNVELADGDGGIISIEVDAFGSAKTKL